MNSEGTDSSLVACAHELKTPLVLMRQLALELENTDDEARQAEIVRRMRLTAERSLRLADNLTKMARLEDAMFELEPIQIGGLCREVVDELSPLTDALEQEVKIRTIKKPLVCVGNRDLLRALLLGLLDNALQHGRKEEQIYITTRIKSGNLELSVRDSGPIIELAQFRKLKENLGKFTMPISARPLSSGLGLAIAGKFVGAMNGELTAHRHHSGGMTFRAMLPISRQLSMLEM